MNEVRFFGEKLRLARLINGFTQQELGDLATVSRQYIHQMEGGTKCPAEDVLNALCEALRVKGAFFRSPVGNDVKIEQCHFRRRRTTPVGLAHRVLAYSTVFEGLVTYINEQLDLPVKDIPHVVPEGEKYTNTEIECAAELCRTQWGLGLNAPISRMTRVLENAGVVITQFDGVSDKVDALSLNRRHPIIVRNSAKESVCRMRFDLAHECGHFVLHDGVETGDKITESEADKFASAFLFPRGAFLNEFPSMVGRRINWKHIFSLKVRWGVSVRALIYRAHFLGLITAQQNRSANVYINKSGWTKTEPYDEEVGPEVPELLVSALDVMRDELGISFEHIATNLGVNVDLLTMISGVTQDRDETYLENVTPIFSR